MKQIFKSNDMVVIKLLLVYSARIETHFRKFIFWQLMYGCIWLALNARLLLFDFILNLTTINNLCLIMFQKQLIAFKCS